MKVSTWVEPDLADRVRRAAEKEGRSVSQWLRLLLERELGRQSWTDSLPAHPRMTGGIGIPIHSPVPSEAPHHPLGCPHDEVEKRTTAALGTRRFCKDCGALLP